MSVLVGLDCDSVKIGYAYFKDNILQDYGVLKSFDADVEGRQFELFSKLHEMFEKHMPNKVILEQSFFSNNFKTSRAITEVIGNAKIICQLFNIPFEAMQVTQWKKITVGSGRAKKEDVMKYVRDNFKVADGICQDSCDAIAICYASILRDGVLNERTIPESIEGNNSGSIKKTRRKRGINVSGTA